MRHENRWGISATDKKAKAWWKWTRAPPTKHLYLLEIFIIFVAKAYAFPLSLYHMTLPRMFVCMLLFFFVELLCFLSFAFSGKFVFFFARSLVLHINWMRSIFTSAVQLIVSYVYLYEYLVVLCAWHIIRIIRKYNRGCICTVPCGCFLA